MTTRALPLLLFPVVLVLSGCISPGSSPEVTFYQLRPAQPSPQAVTSFEGPLIVGPVELSPYINNARLVYRASRHQVAYRELHRWAEPLEQNLANVMATDLSALLNASKVFAYTPRTGLQEDMHSLRLRIHRLEIDEQGIAVLELSAVHLRGNEPLKNPILHLQLSGTPEQTGPEAEVMALNKLVHEASVSLALELNNETNAKETP